MLDESTIRQVHDRADIVDVVSRYVELKRFGSSYKACCPFHSERTPSFTVSPSRNRYKCFGCGKSGSPVDFIMELENMTYPEAIEHLAKMFGIQILHNEKPKTQEQIFKEKEREAMLIAVARVQEFFTQQLVADTPEAAKAREYAYGRWGEQYCKESGIGYGPVSWSALTDFCRTECVDEHSLREVGILRPSQKSGKLFTMFRERVTIPITDRYGKIIGFTARYVGDDPDNNAKYINSSDSTIFHKGEVVFGLRTALRQASRSRRFIIVEGAPDVLKLQSDVVGLTETVATLGTEWSEAQFRQQQRYAPSLVFLPDADPPKNGEAYGPGTKAVMKNGLLALGLGFEVSVREIPLGQDEAGNPVKQDPDSFITGADTFNAIEDVHFAVWYGRKVLAACNSDTDRVKARGDICRDVLAKISDEAILNHCLELLAKEWSKLKQWRDALQVARGNLRREKRAKERESMSAAQKKMDELGIKIESGGYASYNKDGELERWTNFLMEPLYHITDGDNAIRLFRVRNERGVEKVIELRQEELVSLNRFQQRIESLGYFWFKGDIAKLLNLKDYLYSITDTAIQITKLGWNAAEEIYAFGDGIFADNVLYEVNDLGIVKLDGRVFYLPAFSKMHIDERDTFQFERSFSCREHGEVSLNEYVRRMVQVFGDNAKVGFAFLLGALFLDVVKRSSKRYALLNIFGRKGTGKTELGTALMSFFVKLNDPPSLATTSLASLNEMLSCAENNLVHLDEYKNELDLRKIELLKQIWGGSGQTKKNMDGDKKVQRTYVRSAVIITGQDAPTRDDALMSRVIHLQYHNPTFSQEAKRNFEEFQAIAARGVSHLTVQLLKLRKLFEADYAHHYSVCKRELMNALSEDKIEDRVMYNWLAPLAAFHTVQTSLDLPYSYRELFDICVGGIRRQNEQLKQHSDIAVFWQLLDSNHMQGKIVDGSHFTIKCQPTFQPVRKEEIEFGRPKKLLYLNLANVVATLAQRVNGVLVVGKLDALSNESYLLTHPAYLGKRQERFVVLQPNGQPEKRAVIKNGITEYKDVQVRPLAMVFDYELLQESYELNLETVVSGQYLSEEDDRAEPQTFSPQLPTQTALPKTPGIFDDEP